MAEEKRERKRRRRKKGILFLRIWSEREVIGQRGLYRGVSDGPWWKTGGHFV